MLSVYNILGTLYAGSIMIMCHGLAFNELATVYRYYTHTHEEYTHP